jgi:hypothetical protein
MTAPRTREVRAVPASGSCALVAASLFWMDTEENAGMLAPDPCFSISVKLRSYSSCRVGYHETLPEVLEQDPILGIQVSELPQPKPGDLGQDVSACPGGCGFALAARPLCGWAMAIRWQCGDCAMRLDKNYKVPEGFEPVLNYRNDKAGEPVVGECRLKDSGWNGLVFDIGDPVDVVPALPLRASGEIWHTGWDIPTRWAIDALGSCWMDNAHGHALCLVQVSRLLGEAETQMSRNHIRMILGMEPEEPEWMSKARAAGWTPPAGDRNSP